MFSGRFQVPPLQLPNHPSAPVPPSCLSSAQRVRSKLPLSVGICQAPVGTGDSAERETRCPLPGSYSLYLPGDRDSATPGSISVSLGLGKAEEMLTRWDLSRRRKYGEMHSDKDRLQVQEGTENGGHRCMWAAPSVFTLSSLSHCCCYYPDFYCLDMTALSSKVPLRPHGIEFMLRQA